MPRFPVELREKLKMAQSAEAVAALLRPSGVDDAMAAQIWNELSAHRDDRQLDLDELAAVSGGADRDWVKDGCLSTVGADSWCSSNDACWFWDVTYDHEPLAATCPVCGTHLYQEKTETSDRPGYNAVTYRCKNCGHVEVRYQ